MMSCGTSRRTTGAVMLCLVISVAGCGTADRGSVAAQERFLTELREQAPDSAYSGDEQLIATGEQVCADLEAGANLEELGARNPAENLTDETVERIRITQALAAAHLCPGAA